MTGRKRTSPIWSYMEQTGPEEVTCDLCKLKFKYAGRTSVFIRHIQRKHPIEFRCMIKPKTEVSESIETKVKPRKKQIRKLSASIWNYMEKTSPREATCDVCKMKFKYTGGTSNLNKHMRKKHPVEFESMKGPKILKIKFGKIKTHNRTAPIWNYMEKSTGERVTCDLCKKKFKYHGSTSSLIKHLRLIHPEEFEVMNGLKRLESNTNKSPETNSNKSPETNATIFRANHPDEFEVINGHKTEKSNTTPLEHSILSQPVSGPTLDQIVIRVLDEELVPIATLENNTSETLTRGPRPEKIKTHKRSALIWNYMEKTSPVEVTCDICHIKLKYSSSTSNLIKHLRIKHPIDYEHLNDLKAQLLISNDVNSTPSQSPSKPIEPNAIKNYQRYKSDSSKKKEIDDLIVRLLVEGTLPIPILDNDTFQNFVNALNPRYELPKSVTFSEMSSVEATGSEHGNLT